MTRSGLAFVDFLKPVASTKPPEGDRWVHEIKHDGRRGQLVIQKGKVIAYSKSGLNWSKKYPQIVARAGQLPCRSAIIDGEIIVQNEHGVSDFHRLPETIRRRPQDLLFMAFDLLHLDGHDMRGDPLLIRKAALKDLLDGETGPIIYNEHIQIDGKSFFEACERLKLEGMVSKVVTSIYKSGPNKNWLKTKCYTVSDFEVLGTTLTRTGEYVALLKDPATGVYAGTAFINLKRDKREELRQRIQKLRTTQPQIKGTKFKTASWVKPGLVASVRHLRGEESLRHASLQDIRSSVSEDD